MSQEPKNKEEGFMYKFASFIVDKRNLIFLIVAIGLVFSVFSRSWVQVENQLSAYLPKESETYKGLHLMEDEFTTFGTAKLMLVNVSYDEAQAVSEQIADIDGVQSVSFDDTRDHYTNASALYDITFDYSEDDDRCETVMNDIESALDGYDMYVSATFGDTASKTLAQEIGVIVIIVAIVVVSVLVLTSQTYAEVPVLLLTFIAAAVLNMGSNFLLGTISFVSNSVTIVLQLALSVDYAIILCNRYKEEHEKLPIREAVIVALSKAVPEICGSSLTTIGGLVAMLFMEFRLGFEDPLRRPLRLRDEEDRPAHLPRGHHRGHALRQQLPVRLRLQLSEDHQAVRAADRGQYDRYHVRLEQYGRRRSPGRGLHVGKEAPGRARDL